MTIRRLAMISMHTSPLAPLGGKKTGGMNVYIRELAQELGKRGIAIDIFTRRTSAEEPLIDLTLGEHVRVIYLTAGPTQPLSPEEQFAYLSEFTARLMAFATRQNIQYDIVYSHYWLSGWVAQKLKEAWGTPFVQMFHTLGQMKQRITQHLPFMPDQRINMEMQLVQQADCLVAATAAEQTQLIWLYRANRKKIEIIPPGVNIDRFRPIATEEARQRTGLEKNCRVLLFVGRIEKLKAVDTIIEALYQLYQMDPELLRGVCCAIIGGNPHDNDDVEMHHLKTLVEQFGLADTIQFLGAKDQALLPEYYAAATAVIMPSDYESFGMVALEAMASGTPVIASEVGGLQFLIEDGKTGYLIPTREPQALADRIGCLLTNTTQSQEMGQNAAEVARTYAWSNIGNRLLALFEDILAGKTRRNSAAV
jgi:D-inositol-3-phosphate glycosyltransferase